MGDPLYRPFGAWSDLSAKPTARSRSPWEMAHIFASKNAGVEPVGYFKLARQAASRADNAPMLEDLGLTERELGDYDGAISCLRQARTIYKGRGDLLRVALEQSDVLLQAGKKDEALALLRSLQRASSDGASAGILQKMVDEIIPPPPTPTPSPSPVR